MRHPCCVVSVGRPLLLSVVLMGLWVTGARPLSGQVGVRSAQPTSATEPSQVVIEREPLVLKPAEAYRVSLHLKPARSVELVARADGIVSNILVESGKAAREQAEIIRLDTRERQFELDRAKAAFQAAKIEQQAAEAGTAKELAEARLQIAKIDLSLAEYRLDQTTIRAPFDGEVQTVHVVEGEFVRAGQPLATLIDSSRLIVQIPVERETTAPATSVDLRVEGKVTPATVQQVLPLTEPFEPLRELFQSIATGVAVIDNGAGAWRAGQTVHPALIPRSPVTEVPNSAIANTGDGQRRVQVIREGFVRDVPVELLAAVGEERTVVTGGFGDRDELIVRSSEELPDGTQVVARTQLEQQPAASDPASRTPFRPIPPSGQ